MTSVHHYVRSGLDLTPEILLRGDFLKMPHAEENAAEVVDVGPARDGAIVAQLPCDPVGGDVLGLVPGVSTAVAVSVYEPGPDQVTVPLFGPAPELGFGKFEAFLGPAAFANMVDVPVLSPPVVVGVAESSGVGGLVAFAASHEPYSTTNHILSRSQ